MMATKKSRVVVPEKSLPPEEQQAKINEIRKSIGSITSKFPMLCSDASILRYLKARNWNTKKASKMLKETLKWRLDYKPEKIQWEDVAHEAKIGKLYRANYFDKHGRTVLIMRPGLQFVSQRHSPLLCKSTSSTEVQIKYLVYCMERAISDLKPDQKQMVWLIDFQGWNMSSISVKVTKETAHLLQERYPERLGLAILYDPPKVFESFWLLVKPFLEPKTYKKVKFVFRNDQQSWKIMEELFDMDKLESVFGGRNSIGFVYEDYAKRMMEEDKKMSDSTDNECLSHSPSTMILELQHSEPNSDLTSEASDDETDSSTFLEEVEEKIEGFSLGSKDVETVEVDTTSKRSETE
ncbi:hypothetical protein RHGRI_006655 [Rhododendron griersonianum]|uniref:CRAL-TRIO domain-containing protein n=1 Tax=Rhododendron griersonianum TaxID=479676 RepID=A0AAV6KUD0_9ERIC|nr:hypothetical protein RHGRI_006655 [Rhododendron griersonianum]KAG5556098.1 hypothetical protein RHGRI_006655 [Rhododendron griersonianum]KAG5556099.1 hypothetical protein RHGRI_006655 [Rhododendron griersonianum]KAG5556100.1 hypothetical protein RHGRI_006655 [Rhododendron griersonianum]